MQDLSVMLDAKGFGIEIRNQLIKCLLFADDIVLIGKSEEELQLMLNVADEFAKKWNLSFNHNKSKIMVIGKKIDKSKKWALGKSILDETNEYKYLGVYFSRTLEFRYHINEYLKDSFSRKFNYSIRLLGEHGHFNRINFGDSIWNSIIRPSVAYGCAVWFTTSASLTDMLESWQYKVAKMIFSVNLNIPKSAMFQELGWEPINAFMDRQRVSYFSRLKGMPNSRLCKLVFNELHSLPNGTCKYLNYIKDILTSTGLDHYFTSDIKFGTFNRIFGDQVRCKELLEISKKTSLGAYTNMNIKSGKQEYLYGIGDFRSSRLKLLARTNYLPLNDTLKQLHIKDSATCPLCSNADETLEHFLLKCTAFEAIRRQLIESVCDFTSSFIDLGFTDLSPMCQIQFLIGDFGYLLNNDIGDFFDKIGKSMLIQFYKARCEFLQAVI